MTKQVQGHKGKGASSPVEDPNSLRSNSTGRVIDLLSEGPILGIVGGKKGIYFDRTPLKNADESLNFEGVTATLRKGDPVQDVIPGFDATETEVPFNLEVTKPVPVVQQINNVDASAARVKIQVPQLVEYHDNGDIKGTTVELNISLKTATGSYVLQQNVVIDGKTTSAYERAIRVELPAGGAPWTIKVERVTDDSTDSKLINATYWTGYTLLTDAKLSYPDTAMVGLEIDAKSFGSRIPERTYRVRGLITDVPSNYDPITREYTGLWDGTFKQAWHSNPAWVLYALMTNPRFGLGDLIPATAIDKWGLYSIGHYCDKPVPDGKGGFEPRFTFNGSIRTQQDAIKVLDNIASVFRGMIYWGAGSVMVSQDSPSTPAKLVSPANVIGGDFTYTGTPLTSRSSSVAVSWNDPDDLGKTSVLIVQDDELIRKFGDRRRDVAAIGCTSRGQAKRTAEWILYTEAYESELVTYTASLDHADVRPGQIISVADPNYAGARFGGRMVSSTLAGEFTLDAPIVMEAGSTYTLSVTLPTGAIVNYNLVNSATTTDVVTTNDIIASVDDLPQDGSMWVISATDIAPRKFRVLSNTEKEKNVYEINAVLHFDQKFDYVERDVAFDVPSSSVLDDLAIVPPATLNATMQRRPRKGAESQYVVLANWPRSTSANVRAYGVWIKEPDVAERFVGEARDTSIEIPSTHNTTGTYTVKVRALSYDGNETAPVTATVDTSTVTVLMSAPVNWIAEPGFDQITLRGDKSPLEDFAQFNIYGATDASPTLTFLGSTSSTFFVRRPPPGDIYTRYAITQQDYSGNESAATAFINAKTVVDDGGVAPVVPTGLVLTSTLIGDGKTTLRADWDAVTNNGTTYDVRMRRGTGIDVAYPATENSYEWTVLPGEDYTVSVRMRNALGVASAYSAEVTHTAARDTTPPAVPTGFTTVGGFNLFFAEWDANTESDFDHYEVFHADAATDPGANPLDTASLFTTSNRNIFISDLPDSYTRYIFVRAVDTSDNKSAWTAGITTTTEAPPNTFAAPAIPTGLAVSSTLVNSTMADVAVTWSVAADAVSYELGIAQNAGNEIFIPVGGESYDFDVLPGTSVDVRVRSVNAIGVKSNWTTVSSVTAAADSNAPAVPTGLVVDSGFDTFWLSWDENVEADFSHYELYWHTTTPPNAATPPKARTAGRMLAVSVPTTPVTRLHFVRAVDTSGNASAWSTGVEASTVGITAPDISGIVDLTSFASGLTPVEVVATLPTTGNFEGRQAALTTDGKLYRYTSGAWTTEVDGADIKANSIVSASIAAGAINADQIAAGAIIATKLAVGDPSNLFDVEFNDVWEGNLTTWSFTDNTSYPSIDATRYALTSDNFTGGTSNNYRGDIYIPKPIPVEGGKSYFFSYTTAALAAGVTGSVAMYVEFKDKDGTILSNTSVGGVTNYDVGTTPVVTSEIQTAPAGSVSCRIRVRRGANTSGNSVGDFAVYGLVWRRASTGELIVDGAITADHVGANEIIANTANIKDAIISDAKIANLSAAKLTAGSALAGSITVDGTALTEVNYASKQVEKFRSMGALAPMVCWIGTAVYYATREPNTVIYLNGEIQVDAATPTSGSFSANPGDVIEANKPISASHLNDLLLNTVMSGKTFMTQWTRNDSFNAHVYALGADAEVTISCTGQTTVVQTVPAGTFATISTGWLYASTNDVTITSTADILLAREAGGDQAVLWPVAREVLGKRSQTCTYSGSNASSVTASGSIDIDFVDFGVDGLGAIQHVGDGAGGDMEVGLPIDALSTNYVFHHNVADYAVAAIEPCVVRVYDNTGTLQATHDLSAASKAAPVAAEVGTQAGGDPVLYSAGAYMVGTAPFYMRANFSSQEYTALGWREDLRPAFSAGSFGSAGSNISRWASNPAARVNAGTTKIDPGQITVSGTTTLSDWRMGGDETKIDGGSISANTVTANQLSVGMRAIRLANVVFEANSPSTNKITWTGGSLYRTDNGGNATAHTINAETTGKTWSSGTMFLYWDLASPNVIQDTTAASTAYGDNKVVLAIYRGGTDLVTNIGQTIIDGDHIKTGTIEAVHIKAATITANEIAGRTITAGNIVTGTLTANEIAGRTITASKIATGTLTANEIAGRTITAGKIATGTLTANEIATGTITADRIAGNTITAAQIATDAITADELKANSVSATHIVAGTITANEIASASITTSRLQVTGDENLVPDGSFVEGATGMWPKYGGASGTVTFNTGNHLTGGKSLEIKKTTLTESVYTYLHGDYYFPVTAGAVYFAETEAKTGGTAAAAGFYFRIWWYDANKSGLTSPDNYTDIATNQALTGSWKTFSKQVTAPSGARYGRIQFYNHSTNTTAQSFYIDRAVVRRADGASLIVNGSITAGMGIFSGPLQSSNFASGSTGWQINESGSAEFNNLIVRNSLQVGAASDGDVNVGYLTAAHKDNGNPVAQVTTGPVNIGQFFQVGIHGEHRYDSQWDGKGGINYAGTALRVKYRTKTGTTWTSYTTAYTSPIAASSTWQKRDHIFSFMGDYDDFHIVMEMIVYTGSGTKIVDYTNVRNVGIYARALER